jgi:hypothetical protein
MRMSNIVMGFGTYYEWCDHQFIDAARKLEPGKWQGRDIKGKPEMVFYQVDVPLVNFPLSHYPTAEDAAVDTRCNWPWAKDHFRERVCGAPINPGLEWKHWPDGHSASTFLEDGKFNHNYMERFWPRRAHVVKEPTYTVSDWSEKSGRLLRDIIEPMRGIRHEYGDLLSVVSKLSRDPYCRNAILPIYFPEDTGHSGRQPCSMYYDFKRLEQGLEVTYMMRSTDYVRHLADDLWLAVALAFWVRDELQARSAQWKNVPVYRLRFFTSSMHMFANDMVSHRKRMGV